MVTDDAFMAELHADLGSRIDEAAQVWLDKALAEADRGAADHERRGSPPAWELRFAAAGRRCVRGATAKASGPTASAGVGTAAGTTQGEPHPAGLAASVEPGDAARVLLLHAAGADYLTVWRLYAHGTGAERRAVLLALPHLGLGTEAVPLIEDALRTNDTRLVAAAVGPYAARHLDPHAWRHAILKCLFTGVPTAAVADLGRRARGDAELARMLADYARERTAAGRPVPDDLHHVLALTDPRPPGPAGVGRGTQAISSNGIALAPGSSALTEES